MRIAGVLLAAGQGKRFGGGKLLADVGGRPMIAAALDVLQQADLACRIAVVSDACVAALAQERGMTVIHNPHPERGIAGSIGLGLACAQRCDAAMFLAADQPLLTAHSIERLIREFRAHEGGLACLRDETHSGNPAVFAREFYPALAALSGDRGAKSILKANRDRLLEVECLYPHELDDADDPQTLARILTQMKNE